ncbi:MAG TPA: pitrilysin family protein [Steroidobacteraceae bacterium]|jgi:zinc protease|nr:pitrilysin family protein [Steroidobacteraceae bacterium]
MKSSILALGGALFAWAALCVAQPAPESAAPDSLKGVELKGKAPVNPQTLRVVLPRAQEATLSNGLRVALIEDHKLPTFSVQLLLTGGGLDDPDNQHGLAMVTASLLREGTAKRTSRQIAEQLATLGGVFTAGASPSSGETAIGFGGLSEKADAIFAVAADIVRNPAFPAAELDKYKSRFLSQLQQQRAQPEFAAQEEFMRAVYGTHPGSYVVPPEKVLTAMTRADLARYHQAHYVPNNGIVLAYGDFTLKSLVQQLERAFGDWPKGDARTISLPALQPPAKARVLLVDRPASVQTSLWVGGLGIERRSDDYFPMLVMNHILGGGPASRLFINLREDKGYTYGVYSFFNGSRFPGVVLASTDVRTPVTDGALHELMGELHRIGDEPVPEQELKNAKRALIGGFALSLDSPQTLISNLATQKIYNLPADYWDTYPQRVEAITAADVQRVAKKYYDANKLQIVAVGDATEVKKVLEKYGTVETQGAGN